MDRDETLGEHASYLVTWCLNSPQHKIGYADSSHARPSYSVAREQNCPFMAQ